MVSTNIKRRKNVYKKQVSYSINILRVILDIHLEVEYLKTRAGIVEHAVDAEAVGIYPISVIYKMGFVFVVMVAVVNLLAHNKLFNGGQNYVGLVSLRFTL